jgi:predicted dehydrogenase
MNTSRRDFVKGATAFAAGVGFKSNLVTAGSSSRVIGANDRINVGAIGVGGRGTWVAQVFAKVGKEANAQVVTICDVYQKRLNESKKIHNCDGTLDYREVLARKDVDAVLIATPDHWHAPIALAALDAGKDVYLEKPMTHTIDEAHELVKKVKSTGRVLQVGSQTTSAQQWRKAKEAIAEGSIGDMIMSQGSYHRNTKDGEWNWPIDANAGPNGKGDDYIDWKTWLGSAHSRPWDPDRFFRFRKYWDYSGGIATDLFFHVAAPLNICWPEPQFPYRVMASGGIYGGAAFRDKREVPDTFHLVAEYQKGHSVVLTSSMANSQHIPGLIRGHLGTIIMVDHGMFEEPTDHITVRPEQEVIDEAYVSKFGKDERKIPIEKEDDEILHVRNFLDCVRSREKPHLDVETAAHAQVLISMAVMSFRQGKVLYFDEDTWSVKDKAS